MHLRISLLVFLFTSTLLTSQSPFTPADAIDVESLNSVAMSADGDWVVGIISSGYKNRFGVDHFRFRDPSYVRPFAGRLMLYNLDNGSSKDVLGEPAHVVSPEWSPAGNQLAFFMYENEKMGLNTYDAATGTKRAIPLLTDKNIAIGSDLQWLDQNHVLVELRSEDWLADGMELYSEANNGPITVYDAEEPFLKWDAIGNHSNLSIRAIVDLRDGHILEALPEGNYGTVRPLKSDDKLVYQAVKPLKTSYQRRNGVAYTWYLYDVDRPNDTIILAEETKERVSYVFSEDNEWMAWADSGHVFIQSVLDRKVINLTKDKNWLGDEDSTKVKFTPVSWSPDEQHILANSKYGMWRINVANKTVERFLVIDPEAEDNPRYSYVDWHPNNRYVYLSYRAAERWDRGLLRYDFEEEQMEDLQKSGDLYRSWMLSEDGSRLCYRMSDGDRPDDWYFADDQVSNPKAFTKLNPWIKEKKFTKSELVSYLDTDGKKLYGILYYPVDYEEGKKYPLVCEIYERFFDNGYRASMNIIANQGYFGFRPSVNLEEGRPGVAWVKGVTAGINKLIERGLVDPDKIGVHGTSYGGYAASLLISQTDRFAAAINISGKTNMISFLGDSPKIGTRNYAAAEVGQDRIGESLWEAPMKYYEHSAIMYADRMNTPHLLLTGEGDWNVPAANTRELYYALRRLGKKVVWVNYKYAGHGAGWAGSEETYNDQWQRMLDWYVEHFKNEKEEQAAK